LKQKQPEILCQHASNTITERLPLVWDDLMPVGPGDQENLAHFGFLQLRSEKYVIDKYLRS
jgi:hypothetical protein